MLRFIPIMRRSDATVAALSCIPCDEMFERARRYNDELPEDNEWVAKERACREQRGQP